MKVKHPYKYDRDNNSLFAGLDCPDESLTIQSEKDNCDINVIVKRFGVTGVVPQTLRPPLEGDYTGVYDYRTAMDVVVEARHTFEALPAATRAKFQNDPQLFLEFCTDPKNIDEMRTMGLAVPKKEIVEPAPMKVEVVNPAPSAK